MEEEWMKFIKVETDVLGLYMIGDFFFFAKLSCLILRQLYFLCHLKSLTTYIPSPTDRPFPVIP